MNGNDNELIWAAVRVFVALPIVLILAYLLIKFGLSRRYSLTGGTGNRMKLVEQLSLGPKATLSLVEMGGKYYLLAHQDNTMQLIKELDLLPAPEKAAAGDVTELVARSVLDISQNGDKVERDFVPAPILIWNKSLFADLPQKGKAVYAAGRDYLEKFRSHIDSKKRSKQE